MEQIAAALALNARNEVSWRSALRYHKEARTTLLEMLEHSGDHERRQTLHACSLLAADLMRPRPPPHCLLQLQGTVRTWRPCFKCFCITRSRADGSVKSHHMSKLPTGLPLSPMCEGEEKASAGRRRKLLEVKLCTKAW